MVESRCRIHNRLSPGSARDHALFTPVIVDGPGDCRKPSPCMHTSRVRHSRWIYPLTGCKFSGEHTLRTFALPEAQSERRVRCRQKNAWHTVAVKATTCA